MVKGDRLDDRRRQTPGAEQKRADLGVARAHQLALDLFGRPTRRFSAGLHQRQIAGVGQRDHQLAHVLQQPRGEGLVAEPGIAQQPLGDLGHPHRAVLHLLDREAVPRGPVQGGEGVGAERERLQQLQPQVVHRLPDRGHLLGHSEVGRVDQLQHLHAHRRVALDDQRQVVEPALRVRRRLCQFEVGLRHRGQPIELVHQLEHPGRVDVAVQVEGPLEGGPQHRRITGLAEKLVRHRHRSNHRFALGVAGQHDAGRAGVLGLHPGQQLGAVHSRHPHVRHHHVEGRIAQLDQGLFAAHREDHLPALAFFAEQVSKPVEHRHLVVHEQHADLGHAATPIAGTRLRPASGRRIVKVVPLPSSVTNERSPPCLSTTTEREIASP